MTDLRGKGQEGRINIVTVQSVGSVNVRRNRDQRAHNSGEIMRLLYRFGPMNRAQLAQSTTLSPQAVADIMDTLVEKGIVSELSVSRPSRSRGRPSFIYQCNPGHRAVVSVYLGSRYSQILISDAAGRPLIPLASLSQSRTPPEVFEEIASRVRKCFERLRLGLNGTALCLTLHSSPSSSPDLVSSDHLDWHDVDVFGAMEKLLPGVQITVAEASDAAAFAEYFEGQAAGTDVVAIINFGPTITSTIMRNGRPEFGRHGMAGALGRCVVPYGGGMLTIDEALGWRARKSQYAAKAGRTVAWASDVVILAENGDEIAQEIRNDNIEALAIAATWIAAVVDPDLVVLSGIGSEFHPSTRGVFESRCVELIGHPPDRRMFIVSDLGRLAWVTGGTYIALGLGAQQPM